MGEAAAPSLRVAAVGDLHCTRSSQGKLRPLFAEAAARADVLLLCGDLTDYGTPEEAQVLAGELGVVRHLPVLGVLGNHDHESGRVEEVVHILLGAGVRMIEGEPAEVGGLGFAGVKGFGGGFGRHTLEPWGEASTKAFVQESVQEALRLESALARLTTPQKVAVLHYAPIQRTVEGEPPSIFPFLGSSRLEEPINRYGVAAVFHGHAHRGTLEGRTQAGVPVYNVSLPLLRQSWPEGPLVRVVDVPLAPSAERRSGDRRGLAAVP
jgi:Icc-related predicted phosphoesterase